MKLVLGVVETVVVHLAQVLLEGDPALPATKGVGGEVVHVLLAGDGELDAQLMLDFSARGGEIWGEEGEYF